MAIFFVCKHICVITAIISFHLAHFTNTEPNLNLLATEHSLPKLHAFGTALHWTLNKLYQPTPSRKTKNTLQKILHLDSLYTVSICIHVAIIYLLLSAFEHFDMETMVYKKQYFIIIIAMYL